MAAMIPEYHVAIGCPPEWSEAQVRLLAERLASTELPSAVDVYIFRLSHGQIIEQTAIRQGVDE